MLREVKKLEDGELTCNVGQLGALESAGITDCRAWRAVL